VQEIIDSQKCATALIYEHPEDYKPDSKIVRIAFDADAVIFAEDSELIYKKSGIDSFHEHEDELQDVPLEEGPFGKFFKKLSKLRKELGKRYLKIAIVTARNYPSNIRVIKTLREWNIDVDEAFFLGGLPKDGILKAFNAHIFFDDQDSYVKAASCKVPSSRVPYKSSSPLKQFEQVKVDVEYLKKQGI
jgi:5'-nucleotidase